MSKQTHHEHGHHNQSGHGAAKKKIHHDWRFWAVVLMLVGMAVYVLTNDESELPGGQEQAPMPAAAE
ncbi:MAG: hypothetical protein WD851_19930 [Pirellulales bacterium]